MKKLFAILLLVSLSITTFSFASARSMDMTISYGDTNKYIIKEGTTGTMHTSIKATKITSPSGSIAVYTSIQRRVNETWVEKDHSTPIVSEIGKVYENAYYLSGTKDTKAVWTNKTKNSTIAGRFYINSGDGSN